MRHGIVLFASDRGITPAAAARAAEDAGFDTFFVPEHTPVRREAAHPSTGGVGLPDDRYSRTLDPWVALASAAPVTTRIRLGTAVALPVESDPITLAKTIAVQDHIPLVIGAGGAARGGEPEIQVLAMERPTPPLLEQWEDAGVTEAIWGVPDAAPDEVVAFIGRHAARLGRR